MPIYLDGYLIGGVGVSGGTVAQDESVATAGVLGLGTAVAQVVLFEVLSVGSGHLGGWFAGGCWVCPF